MSPTFIETLNALPPLLSVPDLVALGIVRSRAAATMQRHRKQGPPFIYLSPKKIAYPRDALITYLIDRENFSQERKKTK